MRRWLRWTCGRWRRLVLDWIVPDDAFYIPPPQHYSENLTRRFLENGALA